MDLRTRLLVVPDSEWKEMLTIQNKLLEKIKELQLSSAVPITISYITAMEFMEAVRIRRTKFDKLVASNCIKTIKKDRKIYVPIGEIERYFKSSE